MKISINEDSIVNLIEPESESESLMMQEDYVGTKLAYSIGKVDEKRFLRVKKGDDFDHFEDRHGTTIIVPNFSEEIPPSVYYMRLILDSNSIKRNFLPMHAAAVKSRGIAYFILGDTGSGKSYTVSRNMDSIAQVGDDHLIVGNGQVTGNKIIRLKHGGLEQKTIIKQTDIFLKDYLAIYASVNGEPTQRDLPPDEIIEQAQWFLPVLKYGLVPPNEASARKLFNELLFNEGIIKKYLDLFKKFIFSAKNIRAIVGLSELTKEVEKWI